MDDKSATERLFDELMPHPEPPAGFTARVLAAERPPGQREKRWAAAIGAAIATAIGVAGLIAWRVSLPTRPVTLAGHVVAARLRQTIEVAGRAAAVLEPGAEVTWNTTSKGGVQVEQARGDVFYRVEHAGRFRVGTPAGTVEVQGTCFRVALGPGSGGTVALVQVLEGWVELTNAIGARSVEAGETGRLVRGKLPDKIAASDEGPAAPPALIAELRAATARAERAEARLRALPAGEKAGEEASDEDRTGSSAADAGLPPPGKSFDFTPQERRALARQCKFVWAMPSHLSQWSNPDLGRLPLSADERSAVERAMDEQRTQFLATLRAIYIEVVGDRATANTLSTMGLFHEIDSKSPRQDGVDARGLILQEWAGDVPAPSDPSARPVIERFWRLFVTAEDDFIRRLTPLVGAARAARIAHRSTDGEMFGEEPHCAAGKGG